MAVGHSLGGIVLKAWLLGLTTSIRDVALAPPLPATASQRHLPQSVEDTYLCGVQAMVFIGVPHKGAASAGISNRLPWSTTWLRMLGKSSNLQHVLDNLELGFQALLDKYPIPILSIYETQPSRVSTLQAFKSCICIHMGNWHHRAMVIVLMCGHEGVG